MKTLSLPAALLFSNSGPASPHPLLQSRSPSRHSLRVAVLLTLVAVLNLVDLQYTLFAHRLGMLNEMNPLAANFLNNGLDASLVAYKILLVLFGIYTLWRSRFSRWSIAACWGLIALYAWLGITWYRWSLEIIFMLEARARSGF